MIVLKRYSVFKLDSVKFGILLSACVLSLSALFSTLFGARHQEETKNVFSNAAPPPTVILDAGHGGIDSGAVSVLGDEEKDLNLALTKKLGAFLEYAGIRVIYTRTEDVMPESKQSAGSRKTRDLLGRLEIAKEEPEALFVSIHMNTLPVEKYKGLQVFYTDRNDANRALAQVIQNTVASSIQPDNNRKAKDAEGKIFILDRLNQPGILIECGFLTNHEEAALLKDELYQTKLAYVLSRPILDFMAER